MELDHLDHFASVEGQARREVAALVADGAAPGSLLPAFAVARAERLFRAREFTAALAQVAAARRVAAVRAVGRPRAGEEDEMVNRAELLAAIDHEIGTGAIPAVPGRSLTALAGRLITRAFCTESYPSSLRGALLTALDEHCFSHSNLDVVERIATVVEKD